MIWKIWIHLKFLLGKQIKHIQSWIVVEALDNKIVPIINDLAYSLPNISVAYGQTGSLQHATLPNLAQTNKTP